MTANERIALNPSPAEVVVVRAELAARGITESAHRAASPA
jgi:hypothetical protein